MGWMYEVHDSEVWSTSDQYDTREEAIENGKEYFKTEHYDEVDCFDIGESVKPIVPTLNAEWIIEHISENMYDEVGEAAEDWLAYTSREERNKLENRINAVFSEWLKETGNMPDFFIIKNVETIHLHDKI